MPYYIQIYGLGKFPTDKKLKNIHAVLSDNNIMCYFWMNVNCLYSNDIYFKFLWSVSWAAPTRRLQVDLPALLDWWVGWVSLGYFADSLFKAEVGSYPQQQYYILK